MLQVVIKTIGGKSREQLQEAAKKLSDAILLSLLLYVCCVSCAQPDEMQQSETSSASPTNSTVPTQEQPAQEQPTADISAAEPARTVTGEVIIALNYQKISGTASNQYAVWVEDMDGNLVKTLYASRWTAEGGYQTRPDSIALWVGKSGLGSMQKDEVDAVSGATPRSGMQSYAWDLTDTNGDAVLPGEYVFFVEGTLRWRNYVLYSGVIDISGDSVTVELGAEYHYGADDRYAALTSDSPENAMISDVTASFLPVGDK